MSQAEITNGKIKVINVLGSIVKSIDLQQVDGRVVLNMSAFNEGFYFIEIQSGDKQILFKIKK